MGARGICLDILEDGRPMIWVSSLFVQYQKPVGILYVS